MRKFISYCLIFILIFNYAYTEEENDFSPPQLFQSYPELAWLSSFECEHTQEGVSTSEKTFSQRLFGESYVEFDRTLMTIRCLHWILEGGKEAYQHFTKDQNAEKKLSYEHFKNLHQLGKYLLNSHPHLSAEQMKKSMEAALVLGDLGKSEMARKTFEKYGASAIDHDDFYVEALHILEKKPELSPTFSALPEEGKNLLIKSAHLVHYGHINHLEGNEEMFEPLAYSSVIKNHDRFSLLFDLFIFICDVAGAHGHINQQSSLTFTEPTYHSITEVMNSCFFLFDPEKKPIDAYHYALSQKAKDLNLPLKNIKDRLLVKVGAMMRFSTPEGGRLLKQAFDQLDDERVEQCLQALQKPMIRTPTYIPAVLMNSSQNPSLGKSFEERIKKTLTTVLPKIALVILEHQKQVDLGKITPTSPLNFNQFAKIAKNKEFLEQIQEPFSINQEGKIQFEEKSKSTVQSEETHTQVSFKLMD